MIASTLQKNFDRLKFLIAQPSTDVCWSRYNTPDEVICDLEIIENGVLNKDLESIDRLLFLLAPTGDLQEISLSSGWGDEFLDIAETMEKEAKKIKWSK